MGHSHHHFHSDADHGHAHSHQPASYNRAFMVSVGLNMGFVIIEASYGIFANSLALIADAGHNLSDVLGLLFAWGASILAQRSPTPRRTYGLRRTSILAALVNAVFLLVASGGIGWEAVNRFHDPAPVAGGTVMIVAGIGILINSLSALMFASGRKQDLNLRAAFLHLAVDAAVSFGVLLAGLAILWTGLTWFDPVVSLIITIVVVWGTWQLLRDSFNLITDAVPPSIEPAAVRLYLSELPQVSGLHDLHIWAMSTTEIALTAHLVMPAGHPGDAFLASVQQELHDHFGIEHATLQIELGNCDTPCRLEPDHLV